MAIKSFTLIFLSLLLIGCVNRSNTKDTKNPESASNKFNLLNYNLVILLDLSDRIQNINQPQRDQKLIRILLERFEQRQRSLSFNSKDTFLVSIAHQENSNFDFREIGGSLRIDMNGLNKPMFDDKKNKLLMGVEHIYAQAKNNLESDCDIYRFFQNNLSNYLKPSRDYYNKLIILTDGYMSFRNKRPTGTYIPDEDLKILRESGSDWEHIFHKNKMGLDASQINANLRNLEIMLLEINPQNPVVNVNELKILKKFWKTWFEGMGVYEPFFIERMEPIENEVNIIEEFLEKETLQDKMKEPIDLKGKNYESHLLEGREIVSNRKGRYFIIDLTDSSESALEKKTIYFGVGEYTIKNFDKFGDAIKEFNESIRKKLENSEVKNKYEIFVKGSADKGNPNYKRNFEKGFNYNEICRFPRLDNATNLFKGTEECYPITEPIKNEDLPNLRAQFLKDKFDSYYSAQYKRSKILDGSVVLRLSEYERNGTFILYLPEDFFKE